MHYHHIGNTELRDKYIEMALSHEQNIDSEIFLRGLQDRADLLDPNKVKKYINSLEKQKNWHNLARLYVIIKDWRQAVHYYCKSICESLDENNPFGAAYYLKEMAQEGLHMNLFEKAYKGFCEKKDLWWQVRSLQELGWDNELEALILSKKVEIESSGNRDLLQLLYGFTGEKDKLFEIAKKNLTEKL